MGFLLIYLINLFFHQKEFTSTYFHLELGCIQAVTSDIEGARYGIDDRFETLGKKIRTAERWIPYIVVVGGTEVKTGQYSVRVRTRERRWLDFLKEIKDKSKGCPLRSFLSHCNCPGGLYSEDNSLYVLCGATM